MSRLSAVLPPAFYVAFPPLLLALWMQSGCRSSSSSYYSCLSYATASLSSMSVAPRTTNFQACPRQSSQAGIKQKLSSAACFKPCGSVQAVAEFRVQSLFEPNTANRPG